MSLICSLCNAQVGYHFGDDHMKRYHPNHPRFGYTYTSEAYPIAKNVEPTKELTKIKKKINEKQLAKVWENVDYNKMLSGLFSYVEISYVKQFFNFFF